MRPEDIDASPPMTAVLCRRSRPTRGARPRSQRLRPRSNRSHRVRRLAVSRPGTDLAEPAAAVKVALKRLAKRYRHLSEEIADADADLRVLITRTAPDLLELPGVGTETAGQLLVAAGDNPDRLASEASFAHLCPAAPVPASSGRTDRHRLNRGGLRLAWVVRQSESRPIVDHRRNSLR
ncbi:transposase [Streptomyces microflavus]|uniref:transposase n=1 Tax=Streptomyces microflavus TaxID=1919 RepID=UPI00365705A6